MSDIERAIAKIRLQGNGVGGDRYEAFSEVDKQLLSPQNSNESINELTHEDIKQVAPVLQQEGRNRMSLPDESSGGQTDVSAGNEPRIAQKLRQPELARKNTSRPVFKLPLEELRKNGNLLPDMPKCRITEEYRRIKRPLLKNTLTDSRSPNSNIIMVTSSVAGEGKTYTALNLAMSFTLERDRTVLLIDGDVIKGAAGKALGVEPSANGLIDYLSGNCSEIGQTILQTNVPSFNFMPAGSTNDNANELLSSSNMTRCIDELSKRYSDGIIIIDSPPILQTNEANIIAGYAGQIVFVVAEADTPQKVVSQALGYIEKDKYVGILLNKSHAVNKSYKYGYNYGYE